ncbi:hypothetical protein DFA_07328 [Cavenderia fasciculata]|uniref:Uncharacterized protein n=1 Tax=Cavenderia fasciculata TaxID=261658 RepID=F4PW44_CACFS|nr:uncharacterized protein DFA_07328 [Cavenderia fasciculata]EGG20208.1 hypothetical protein DFA_07328 [Cavenderia fasciculata]|eukprot:XP_004367191.1 hypothetical protein DFA_07328 [Cavenderia fasciculata]
MPVCGNNSCDKEYDETTLDQCCYHPGSAIFHDGMKGWSCCSKRVIEFEDFLQISGCASGRHKEKQKKEPTTIVQHNPSTSLSASTVETYGTSNPKNDKFAPKPISQAEASKKIVLPPKEYVEVNDPENAVIAVNGPCLRQGCKSVYVDESSRQQECIYHSGEPVFHDGSKGYSCCKPKAAIFEEFLKIKGCKTGKHRFVGEKKVQENSIVCKYDWYQSYDAVHLTIYAKQANTQLSKIEFTDNQTIDIHIVLRDNKEFNKVLHLAGTIDTQKSTITFLSTKIELKLIKDPQVSFSKLEQDELDLFRYQV